jgi:plasmid maintenance system antidote protein VapI
MPKVNSEYNLLIAERIKLIMKIAGLEILGLSKITSISDSHIYSLLRGRRNLTDEVADRLGKALDFDGQIIFKLNKEIPTSISKSMNLSKFKLAYKLNEEYFLDARIDRKGRAFIEYELLTTTLFDHPVYAWEVKLACKEQKRNYSSNEIIGYLKYFVVRKLLKSEKRPIKKRNGGFGNRLVDVFWK